MSTDADRTADLARVLASILKDADGNVEQIARLLRTPRRLGQRAFAKGMFGHELRLPRDPKFNVGGGGVVIQCEDASAPEVKYALKVPRPSLFPPGQGEQSKLEVDKAIWEQQVHLPLVHENIAKLYGVEKVMIAQDGPHRTELPCTLIEWVDGAQPLHAYLATRTDSPQQIASLLAQACRALAHLHAAGVVHWDIKGDNVLVSSSGVVKLMDLGNARRLDAPGVAYTDADVAESSYLNLPPALHRRVREAREQAPEDARISRNRAPCELRVGELSWDRPWLDLYMLGREVNSLFGFDAAALALDDELDVEREHDAADTERVFVGEDGVYVYAFLRELVTRLLAASDPEQDAFYATADEVAEALQRLEPAYGDATNVPELQAVPQHVLRLPPKDNLPWTDRVATLMNSRALLRLKRHRQLATVHHVFPGAEHSRWEHTAGAFGELLQRLRSLYADRSSVRFRLDTSRLDVTALMLATLLHDLGHPAFGHQLEESPLVSRDLHHERFTLDVLRYCRSGGSGDGAVAAGELRPLLERHWHSPDFSVEQLLDRTIKLLEVAASPRGEVGRETSSQRIRRVHTELLSSLVSGQLDADKSDYLVRDAHHSGVEYPNGIDRHRLDQALTALVVEDGHPPIGMIGITEKGILPLESMLIARYQMFRAVYWQHTVRAMTVMLQEAVERYAAPSGSSARTARERVEEVLHQFRTLPDEEAILWLRGRDGRGIRVAELCDGVLGGRDHVFWEVAEFHGDALPQPRGRRRGRSDHELYMQIRELWSGDELPGLATVEQRRAIRRQVAERLTALAREQGRRVGPAIKGADLLLDIPVVDSDDAQQLYVAVGTGASRRALPLAMRTPLAQAVAAAFEASVRPARVFVRPAVGRRLAADRNLEWFGAAVRTVVEEVFDLQLRLGVP